MAYLLWISLIFLASAYLLRSYLWGTSKAKNIKGKLPPGPRGLPILGSLPMLGENPHHDLRKLSQKYGPIMYLRLGFVPTIVVSSPEWAEQFLKTHDLVFASRPPLEAAKHMSYEQRNLGFAPYGPYWRNIRRMCTLELLSSSKINSFGPMRREEIGLLVQFLREACLNRSVVDLSAKISSMSADMSCRMVFGKKYVEKEFDERGFKAVIQQGMQLAATPNLSDYLPYVGALDLQGLAKKMKAVSRVFDAFLEKIIDEHIETRKEGESRDFVDVMLGFVGSEKTEYRIERSNIKAILLDMYVGSMDTSAVAIEWAISELIRHPCVMKKVQKEIESTVGMQRMVEEFDLDSLEYLDMVIKETFRIHPVAPLLIPHFSTKDYTIDGYYIPCNSRIFINTWAIGRDSNVWSDPNKFLPERFEGKTIDIGGHDFQLLPFGSGRRGCPGMQLGLTVVRLVVAQLVHCFDWELPEGMLPLELDMTEEFGLATSRAKHLMVIPSYRLKI